MLMTQQGLGSGYLKREGRECDYKDKATVIMAEVWTPKEEKRTNLESGPTNSTVIT